MRALTLLDEYALDPVLHVLGERHVGEAGLRVYAATMPTHADIVDAATDAAQVEAGTSSTVWAFPSRLQWLTEAELTCRMHRYITVSQAVSRADVRMSAQGRKALLGTNHDIEFVHGSTTCGAVEVVYCFATSTKRGKQQSPAAGINNDIAWLVGHPSPPERHVVAFFPRMCSGYGVSGHARPYNLAGQSFTPSARTVLLTDTLQATAFTGMAQQAFTNIFMRVAPIRGNRHKWSLAATALPPPGVVTIGSMQVARSIVLSPQDPVWAVVLSYP